MRIPIRIKPGGPKPSARLLVRRVGKIHLTTKQRKLSPSHPNTQLDWPAQIEHGEPRIFRHTTSWTITRLAVGVMLLLGLNGVARAATFRSANSNNHISVENGGTAALSDIKNALPHAPRQRVDAANKICLLSANLLVADGGTLSLHGAAVGGDVHELRLLCNDNTAATNSYLSVDADWGTLNLNATPVTSWDLAASALTPDI